MLKYPHCGLSTILKGFFVHVLGEPPAHDVVWSIGGRELQEGAGNGIRIDNSKPYKSILIKDDLTRRDSGALVCKATNMEGQATNQLEVSVVAKPPMCQDRLLVSNITSSSCRLTWQPPKDDGGLPLRYIIEKYTSSGDSWTVHVRFLTQCENCGNLLSRFLRKIP